MNTFDIEWHWDVSYLETLVRQENIRTRVQLGGPEAILLAEHPPTITLGKRGGTVFNVPEDTTVEQINRGGLATWHGPGQLAFYPIIELNRYKIGVRTLACILETATISTLHYLGIEGTRNPLSPGIWVHNRKIAALGLDVKKGINIHGVALNIHNDTSCFSTIEACGDSSIVYTSVIQELCTSSFSIVDIGRTWIQMFTRTLCETTGINSCN